MDRRTENHRSSARLAVLVSALLLSSMTLTSASGCRVIRERRAHRAAARAADKAAKGAAKAATAQTPSEPRAHQLPSGNPNARGGESQSSWMKRQAIATGDNASPNQTPMKVVDERALATASPKAQTAQPPEPSIDIVRQSHERVFNRQSKEEASYSRAVEMHASGDLAQALRELERAIAYNPKFTRAYLESGDIYLEMAQYERAERQFALAVRTEPRNFMAQYRHGQVLHQLGRLDEANRAYLRALSIRPSDFDANLGISIVLLEMGRAEQSLPYGQRAVKSEPPSGRARMHLGNVYAAIGRHEEAVVEYQQAAELMDAPTPGLLLNMAESLNELGRYAEMVGALDQLVRMKPSAIGYERLGSGLFRLRRYDESLAAFRRATDYDEQYYPAYNGIAVCELNQYLWSSKTDGDARKHAVAAMRKSLRLERKQPRIVELLRRYTKASSTEK